MPGSEAIVDLAAVAHNVRLLAGCTHAGLMAVVKADAFGHGVVPVARTALAHGAQWLGVTSCAEALALRAAGIGAPLLSWLHAPDEDFEPVISAGVDLSVSSPEYLDAIALAARRLAVPAAVHLKVDTGMSRNGASPADWPELLRWAGKWEREGCIEVRAVWSHLAYADHPDHPSVANQIGGFVEAVRIARGAGLDPALLHLANSAATLAVPAAHFDLVRLGIAIYGVEPVAARSYGLRPALTLRAPVVMVRRVPAGTGVSYHHDHITAQETTLALVPLGYADGVPRSVVGRAQVLLGGVRCPIVGQVAMDQFVVDASAVDARGGTVRIGDEVVLFGAGSGGGGPTAAPTVAEWAQWAGTNPHEILTGIGARVRRRYINDAWTGDHD